MNAAVSGHQPHHHFDDTERTAVHRNILARRDVRGQFLPDPVTDDMLARVVPVAWLCISHVRHFLDRPELQGAGWRQRLPLDELVQFDGWGGDSADADALRSARRRNQATAARSIPPA